MTDWKEITSQDDIHELLETYGGFHDSCIVSASYKSGAFVNDMKVKYGGSPSEHELFIVFHSQWNPQILEMCFTGLRQLRLAGWAHNYWCDEILDAYLSFHEGLLPGDPDRVIVWADTYDFDVKNIDNTIHEPSDTYIVANGLRWRLIDPKEEL